MSEVGNGCICSCQFQVGHTAGDPAKCQCLSDIRQDPAVCLQMIRQCSNAELPRVIISHLRCYGGQDLHSHNVDGLNNRIPQRHFSLVGTAGIVDCRTEFIIIRFIDNRRCKRHLLTVDCRGIGRKDLESGPRLAHGIGCTVQSKACLLLSSSTHQGFYQSGRLVDHNTGSLGLRRDCDPLAKDRIPFFHHRFPEGGGTGFCLTRRSIHKVK